MSSSFEVHDARPILFSSSSSLKSSVVPVFWGNDLSVLVSPPNLSLINVYPAGTYLRTVVILNIIAQCAVVIGIFLSVYFQNIKYLLQCAIFLILTAVVHATLIKEGGGSGSTIEKFDFAPVHGLSDPHEKTIVYPTPDNPYMNVLLSDYTERPYREAANKTWSARFDPEYANRIKNESKKSFYETLFTDVGDVYHKGSSARQFYTMPVTTIPNDADAFLTFLAGGK